MAKIGIDISRWQGQPDYKLLSKDIDFVIVQIGYGKYASQVDMSFEYNYQNAKKYGVPIGGYWYSYATTVEEASMEARACLENIGGKQFEYPIYIDLEENLDILGKARVSAIAEAFCSILENAGIFTGIYISRSPAQTYLTANVTDKYAMWIAEYAPKCNYDREYGMWQYSSTGLVRGINGNVDMDKCYVDYPAVIKAGGFNGYPKLEPTKVLDENGFKKGDKSLGVYYLKTMLKKLGYKLDTTNGFGDGTEKAVNEVLVSKNYVPNGIAGKGFADIVSKLI